MNTQYFHCFTQVVAVARIARGLELEVDPDLREHLRVEVLRDDVIRLKMSRRQHFDDTPTFAVCADLDAARADFNVEETDGHVNVRTAKMTLTVFKHPFRVEAHRADGSVIFRSHEDDAKRSWAYATLNDEFIVRRRCHREDAVFGLGEKTGRFNRRGRDFTLWNTDVLNPSTAGIAAATYDQSDPRRDPRGTAFDPYYVSIPFFYHQPQHIDQSAMAGFFFDNGYEGRFEFGEDEEYLVHFKGGQYTEYVIAGPAMSEVLAAYTWLTGRMAPPPLWALGYHQCRWFPYTQPDVERMAQKHREKQIPCDVLWLDIDYMDGYRVFTWDKKRFPDPAEMLERLREQGFRVVTIIDPGVKFEPGYPVFDEAMRRDVLCKTEAGMIYVGQVWPGKTAFPDFATAEGRKWWGELNAEHVRSGLAGIWNDMNEPATGDIPGGPMRFGNGRFPHERFHNQYGLLMAMGTVEGLLEARPDDRTFVLSRAGSAGIQRYAANWLGDNCSRWDHLWMSIPMSLGFGVSGQPFLGADIGGFIENANAELVLRWFQYGVLTPFCRNHNCTNQSDQYPWSFGATVEALCRDAIDLRYRLMPYIYSAFIGSSETGAPVQKPLVFDFQHDRTTVNIDDQYLFGDSLLVAPVYTEGCTARQVYLPAGTWYHWHTGEKFAGQRFIVAGTPMDYIPLYARGGAVVPMWTDAPASTMDHHPAVMELHVFIPDEDGETRSMLHEDDGRTFAFRDGAFFRTVFTLRRSGPRVTLTAVVEGDGYAGFQRREFLIRFHGLTARRVTVDGRAQEVSDGVLTLANTGSGFTLEAL